MIHSNKMSEILTRGRMHGEELCNIDTELILTHWQKFLVKCMSHAASTTSTNCTSRSAERGLSFSCPPQKLLTPKLKLNDSNSFSTSSIDSSDGTNYSRPKLWRRDSWFLHLVSIANTSTKRHARICCFSTKFAELTHFRQSIWADLLISSPVSAGELAAPTCARQRYRIIRIISKIILSITDRCCNANLFRLCKRGKRDNYLHQQSKFNVSQTEVTDMVRTRTTAMRAVGAIFPSPWYVLKVDKSTLTDILKGYRSWVNFNSRGDR